MARQTTRRRTWTALALVGALVAVTAGLWGVQRWAPFGRDDAVDWPENVQPVVDYVEAATGQHFVHRVVIEYIAGAAKYGDRVGPATVEPSDEDRATAATDEAVARALGLWAGDASIVEMHQVYDGAEPSPVTWLTDDNTVVINAKDDSSELSPFVRAELTARLTLALDDQLFHIVEQATVAPTPQQYQAVVAVTSGHATWVHDLYVDEFTDDELEEYSTSNDEANNEWADASGEVPVAYRAIRAVGQQMGPMFIEALTEQSRTLVAKALGGDMPTALDQVSLPVGKYLRRDDVEDVSDPPGPAGADVHYSRQMGPFAAYLLFATGVPLHVALTASDGWGNDRYTAYTLAGRVCVDVHLVADSRNDADRMENGLNGWAQARPAESEALVGRDGVDLYATACDPGTDVEQLAPDDAAVQHYLARAQELQVRADQSGDPALAECVAVAYFGAHDATSMYESFEYYDEFDALQQDCLTAV
jgi:hypothetical protein